MSASNKVRNAIVRGAIIGLVGLLPVPAVMAAHLNLNAIYSPNKADPTHDRFVNTTPNSGYCASYPTQCPNQFSILVPIEFRTELGIDPAVNLADPRQGAYFSLPSSFRTVTVTHEKTGATADLKFRISGFGATYSVRNMPAGESHLQLWTSTWVNASSPCRYSGYGVYSNSYYRFFWKVPLDIGACSKRAVKPVPAPFFYSGFAIAYELVTPNPLAMDIGRYSGSLTLRVGPQQDIDFGDLMLPSDDALTLNFDLAVNHLLKVDFPPGSERAVLQPAQGWQGWLNTGKPPPTLTASQRFNLSSSGRFRIYLSCEYTLDETCAIQEATGASKVPVDIAVTLPWGVVTHPGQQPVQRHKLSMGSTNAQEFQTVQVQFERTASLHYEVSGSSTAEMTGHAGQTYRGTATVIFDASI